MITIYPREEKERLQDHQVYDLRSDTYIHKVAQIVISPGVYDTETSINKLVKIVIFTIF